VSGSKRRPLERLGLWTASIALFLVIWQAVGASEAVFAIEPPSEVFPVLLEELGDGELVTALLGTLRLAAVGLIAGIVVGIPLGLVTGSSRRAAWALDPLLNAGFATPMAIILPVIGLYLGLTFDAKVFVVFLFCVFVIAINTAGGVRSVAPDLRELGKSFRLPRRHVATRIVLRGASPQLLTGVRIAVSRAVQGAVLADLFLEADYLGLYLIEAGSTFDVSVLLAGVFAITVVAAGLMALAHALENWLLRWKLTD
jgi:ABC-type nitrate/sulfonate/bicarbonate transport system permease component